MAMLLLALTALLLPACMLAEQCVVKPPEAIIDTETAWSTPIVPGLSIKPLVTKEYNGVGSANFVIVTVDPNKHYAPHGHAGREEVIYIIKGSASMSYWGPGMPEKVTVDLKPGSFHYMQVGGLHDINAGEEGVEFLAAASPGPFMWDLFGSWPASLDATPRSTVEVLGQAPCPPEAKQDAEL